MNKRKIEEIVYKFHDKVYGLCYKILQDVELAKDATQDVFLKVVKSISNFRKECSFSTWLYRVTTNTALDYLRRIKRSRTVIVTFEESSQVDPETGEIVFTPMPANNPDILEELKKERARELIRQALNELPEGDKVILILKEWEGLSYKEIAEILGCPVGTVGSRLHNATAKLAKILKSMLSKEEVNNDGM